MASPKKEAKFEDSLERLESIVTALEEGGLPLDESLQRFEEGIKLFRACDDALKAAEKKIEILMRKADGALEAEPFDEGSGSAKCEPTPAPPDAGYEDEDTLF